MSFPDHSPNYRKPKPVTSDIRRHCNIFFDEGLFGAGQSVNSDSIAVYAPLPFHIELASNLLIHPRYTNQAITVEEFSEIASRSLIFLRSILSILGPINANLVEAFSFSRVSKNENLLRKKGHQRHVFVTDHDEDVLNTNRLDTIGEKKEEEEYLNCMIANHGRTSRCAKDFWHVVGWSFNCSIRYPKRWKYLKVWLEYMLDVLEADFTERENLDLNYHLMENDNKTGVYKEDYDSKFLSQSIILCHIAKIYDNSSAHRRIIKSIFADGERESLRSFPQVFPNETKVPKSRDFEELRAQRYNRFVASNLVDSDPENEHCDFDLVTEYNFEEDQDIQKLKESSVTDLWMGGSEAIILRQRLITLLSLVAEKVPNQFVNYIDLHKLMFEFIRPLPIPLFTHLFSSSKSSYISDTVYISLSQVLLSRLLPKPATGRMTIDMDIDNFLSQAVLEKYYLPFAAFTSSSHDNAQVSIILENLLRLAFNRQTCSCSPSLENALEKGINAREEKVKRQRKRRLESNASRTTNEECIWLKASGVRLRNFYSWLKKPEEKFAEKDKP